MGTVRTERLLAFARHLYVQGRHHEAQRVCSRLATLEAAGCLRAEDAVALNVIQARLALGSADYTTAEERALRVVEHPASVVGGSAHAEASLLLGRALARSDRVAESIRSMEEALARRSPQVSPVRKDVVLDLSRELGQLYLRDGRHREASRLLEKALERALTMSSLDREYVTNLLGETLSAHSKTDDDPPQAHQAREASMLMKHAQRLKGGHPRDIDSLQIAECERLFDTAWETVSTSDLREWLTDIGVALWLVGGWKTILRLWRRLFMRADRLLGCAPFTTMTEAAKCAEKLALWCAEVGEGRAEETLRTFLIRCRENEGDQFILSFDLSGLALGRLWRGDYEGSLELLDQAEELRRIAGKKCGPLGFSPVKRARALKGCGRLAEAERLMRALIEDDVSERGVGDSRTALLCAELAESVYDQGRANEAEQILAASRECRADSEDVTWPGGTDYHLAYAQLSRGRLAAKMRLPEASEALLATWRESDEAFGRVTFVGASARTEWAAHETRLGRVTGAVRREAAIALRAQRSLKHVGHPDLVRAREVMREVGSLLG